MNDDQLLESRMRSVLEADAGARRLVALHRGARRESRLAGAFRAGVFVPLTIAVVAAALVTGVALADWRAQRASPAASQAAAATFPGPLALAGGSPSAGFGLISMSANAGLLRSEISEQPLLTIPNHVGGVAVSPNGRLVAIWLAVNAAATTSTPQVQSVSYELHVLDTVDRSIGPSLFDTGGESPIGLIWSTDGTGLVVGIQTLARSINFGDQSWFTVDVATHVTSAIPTFRSIATSAYSWDRQQDVITAGGADGGKRVFLRLHAGHLESSTIPAERFVAAVDTYGKGIVIVSLGPCAGALGAGGLGQCTSAEVRDQATFHVISSASFQPAPNDAYPSVIFRPRSLDLIVQVRLPNGDARVELWPDLGRGPHVLLASYTQASTFRAPVDAMIPRADGSAILLLHFDGSAGGRWFGELVSLADPNERSPYEITAGGNPIASVALDPAFVRAMDGTNFSPGTISPAFRATNAVRVVQASSEGATFASFPSAAGSQPCEIRGGGPPPGMTIAATCRTAVGTQGSGYLVSFTYSWDARQFHYAGEPSAGELKHTWSFIVDSTGRVTPQSDSGNFPPQYAK